MTQDEKRTALLEAFLEHVPFDGWSQTALRAGARDCGFDLSEAQALYPGGLRQMMESFNRRIDAAMLDELESLDLETMKVREKVAAGVRIRLELLAPYRDALRRGLTYLSLPFTAPLAARMTWQTVDAIWYAAGDQASDYNYYSKRSLLFGVYSSTLLYWLNDGSEGSQATWAFLDRRIDEVLKIGGRLGKGMKRFLDLPEEMMKRRGKPGRRLRSLKRL